MQLDGGASGGGVELVSGQAVDSSLAVSDLSSATIVPEPDVGLLWASGILTVLALARGRRHSARRVV